MWKISILLFAVSCSSFVHTADALQATATIVNGSVHGTITFTESNGVVNITGTIHGLTPGKHGFHVHEGNDLSNNCLASGPHFNPENKTHGAPEDENRHVGDLGNIVHNGTSNVTEVHFSDRVIKLQGSHSIIGRALVIHLGEDDLGRGGYADSKTTGHAGARVACAVIQSNTGLSITPNSILFMTTVITTIIMKMSL